MPYHDVRHYVGTTISEEALVVHEKELQACPPPQEALVKPLYVKWGHEAGDVDTLEVV